MTAMSSNGAVLYVAASPHCEALSSIHETQYECEDIQGDAALFEALGVGLGRAEVTDIALAAKRLGQDPRRGVATVRCAGICAMSQLTSRASAGATGAAGLALELLVGASLACMQQQSVCGACVCDHGRARQGVHASAHTSSNTCVLSQCWGARFFGKFLGTHADYYVFETTLQNPPAEPEEQPGEARVQQRMSVKVPACTRGEAAACCTVAILDASPASLRVSNSTCTCAWSLNN